MSYKGNFISVYKEAATDEDIKMLKWPTPHREWYVVRYHPVVGCGDVYLEDSITESVAEQIGIQRLLELMTRSNVDCGVVRIDHCPYDGWIVEHYLEPVSRRDNPQISYQQLLDLAHELDTVVMPDLHIDYVDLT